jgi:hypothetical protein
MCGLVFSFPLPVCTWFDLVFEVVKLKIKRVGKKILCEIVQSFVTSFDNAVHYYVLKVHVTVFYITRLTKKNATTMLNN